MEESSQASMLRFQAEHLKPKIAPFRFFRLKTENLKLKTFPLSLLFLKHPIALEQRFKAISRQPRLGIRIAFQIGVPERGGRGAN